VWKKTNYPRESTKGTELDNSGGGGGGEKEKKRLHRAVGMHTDPCGGPIRKKKKGGGGGFWKSRNKGWGGEK